MFRVWVFGFGLGLGVRGFTSFDLHMSLATPTVNKLVFRDVLLQFRKALSETF